MNKGNSLKRILVTGASGLLGLNFCSFYCQKYQITGISNKTKLYGVPFHYVNYDLMHVDPEKLLESFCPDVIFHCAALANIDQCEKNPELAEALNSNLPGKLAASAGKHGIKFVHISTDAVFDGEDCGSDGYREEDEPNPVSCYAESKLKGENIVIANNSDALIARVNFYGWSAAGGRSLVEFFYNKLASGEQVNGFSDVFFSTLYVRSLVKLIDEMIDLNAHGIYHVFSSEYQSKYSFGVSIAERFGFDPNLIHPVSWKEGGLSARRSPNLIMNTNKLRSLLVHDLPSQQECLDLFYQDTVNGHRDRIQSYLVYAQ